MPPNRVRQMGWRLYAIVRNRARNEISLTRSRAPCGGARLNGGGMVKAAGGAAADLVDLAYRYREYIRLIETWRTVLAGGRCWACGGIHDAWDFARRVVR